MDSEFISDVELYDSEWIACRKIAQYLTAKYQGKPDNEANLLVLAFEGCDKIRELGLESWCNPFRPHPKIANAVSPVFYISHRMSPIDRERYAAEVRGGQADDLWREKRRSMSQ